MARRGQSREREAFWREQVCRQEASGMSVRWFCQANGLGEVSFYLWRRKLKALAASPGPEFVPVMIAPRLGGGARITVELRGGRCLHLPETYCDLATT